MWGFGTYHVVANIIIIIFVAVTCGEVKQHVCLDLEGSRLTIQEEKGAKERDVRVRENYFVKLVADEGLVHNL